MIWESITIALRALTVNKLRTILTMLGIIIGVGAVIGLISIGNGFQAQINESFASLGTNVVWIQSGRFNIFGPGGDSGSSQVNQKPPEPLTVADAEAMADPLQLADVVAVAPEYSSYGAVVRGQISLNSSFLGVTPSYETVRNRRPVLGSFITADQVSRRARVAVLSASVAQELFESYEYPIGETIRLKGVPFEVIGVLEEEGQSGFGGGQDNSILIPLSTAQTRLENAGVHRGSLIVSTIYLQAASPERMEAISDQMTRLMRDRHGLFEAEPDDFTIITQSQLLEFGSGIAAGLTAFLGSIAGVSLFVGGIGIMNIMLVSVTERTREIGIRKAVGAKRSDILLQFLIEAIVLSLIGGFIGIGLGYGVSLLLPVVMPDLGDTVVTINSILLATSFALAIGLFFGVYPATRASRLKPIEALRYE
ncbi:MAG: ABC transporter permease [Anaerolineae bacterium]|nr:ABC transporter permease [Anaerolineae bacterium]